MQNFSLDLETAHQLLENILEARRHSSCPFFPRQEENFRNHCLSVAYIAEQIATTSGRLNPQQAYVLGLLHDCGRISDEKTDGTFHGLTGYDYLCQAGHPQAAQIAFSHCFYDPQLNLSMYRLKAQDYVRCRELLKELDFGEYDYLIQLADILNDCGQSCTIEYRFASVARRHPIGAEAVELSIKKFRELKAYFDNLCKTDIYSLLQIDEQMSV